MKKVKSESELERIEAVKLYLTALIISALFTGLGVFAVIMGV